MKNKLILIILLFSTQILLSATTNFTHKRALLIDNHEYSDSNVLPDNSKNITKLAEELSYLGFDVRVSTNLPEGELKSKINQFYQSLPEESVSLLYFGGHIFTETNQRSVLLPINVNDKSSTRNLISIKEISQLAISNDITGQNQNFLLLDASFTSEQIDSYQLSLNQISSNKGMIVSAHNAKSTNLLGTPSNYIPTFIEELFEPQKIKSAFYKIDSKIGSTSWVNTDGFMGDIFRAEVAAAMVITAATTSVSVFDMPSFPFPPPKASASYTFDKQLFSGISNLTQSSNRIENALKKSGYYEKSYYQIPNGYALVTRIEKMEPDGTPAVEGERWNVNDTGTSGSFDFLSYFKSLFFAKNGHYRIIVFLVTSDNVQMTERIMLMSEGEDFLSSGLNRLPSDFDDMPFTDDHYCTALIYEWYKVEHEEAKFMEPSKFLGQYHLAKNKFVEYLEAEK